MVDDVLLKFSGADFSASGYGKYQEIPDVRNSLYAAWLLGTDLDDNPGRDATGNGRTLTLPSGSAVGGLTDPQITAAGSGGTDGTYNLIFTGGGGTGAAGTVTVSGGVATSIALTSVGSGYTSAPAVSLVNATGLAGATATVKRIGQGAKSFQFGPSNSALSSIVGDTLGAINGEVTLLTIARASFNQQVALIGNYAGSGVRGMLGGLIANGGSKSYLVETAQITSGTVVDPSRATLWAVYASVFTRTSVMQVEWRTGLSTASVPVTRADAVLGGANAIRLGQQPTAFGTVAGSEIAAAAVASKAWTQAEVATWGAAMAAKLAGYGLTL